MCGTTDVGATAQDGEDPAQTLCPRLRDAEYIEVRVTRRPEVGCTVNSKAKVERTAYNQSRHERQPWDTQIACAPEGQ